MDKAIVEQLEKAVAQLTLTIKEKFDEFGATSGEVKELQAKLAEVQKEFSEKRHQFEISQMKTATLDRARKSEVETRLDELFLAKALCHDVATKSFNKAAFDKIKSLPVYQDAIKTAATFDAVSGMTSTGSGTGDEWVPEAFSSTLFEEIWLSLEVAKLFRRIPMPAPTYTLPFNPGRIIALAGTEGASVAKQTPSTDKLVFTAKKIMAIVEMTDEFEQDSLVPALNFLRTQIIDAFALGQETMCLNGEISGNKLYASSHTPASTDVRSLVNGIRRDAMNLSAKVDFGAASGFTADNLRALRTQMGKYGKKPGDLAYIMDIAQYNSCLGFTGYQYLYQYGAGAVVLSGELGRLDGIPIIVSELLPGGTTDAADALGLLNASGVWDDTTKTKKTCVLVNKNGYMWGDRTDFSLELWRNPLSQTTNLIGSQRLDFERVGSDTAKFCAVGYNI